MVSKENTRVAKIIFGNDEPPDWLIGAIPSFAHILAGNIKRESTGLNRPVLRRRLEALAKAANLVFQELDDFQELMPFLLAHVENSPDPASPCNITTGFLPNENEMRHGIEALASICENALAKLPRRQGQAKIRQDGDVPKGKTLCALTICLLWQHVHSRWPGINFIKAQSACVALWTEAGGKRRQWGNTPSGWRSSLKEAKSFRGSWRVKFLEKMIVRMKTQKSNVSNARAKIRKK